jgi:pentatricopeptide repeat protein
LKCEFKTFNILINALLQGGRKDEANNLFSSVSGNGIVPDGVTYSLVIESHIESLLEEVMICFYHGRSLGMGQATDHSEILKNNIF